MALIADEALLRRHVGLTHGLDQLLLAAELGAVARFSCMPRAGLGLSELRVSGGNVAFVPLLVGLTILFKSPVIPSGEVRDELRTPCLYWRPLLVAFIAVYWFPDPDSPKRSAETAQRRSALAGSSAHALTPCGWSARLASFGTVYASRQSSR